MEKYGVLEKIEASEKTQKNIKQGCCILQWWQAWWTSSRSSTTYMADNQSLARCPCKIDQFLQCKIVKFDSKCRKHKNIKIYYRKWNNQWTRDRERERERLSTINPGNHNTFCQREQHEREGGTIPIHDLQHVDPSLQNNTNMNICQVLRKTKVTWA